MGVLNLAQVPGGTGSKNPEAVAHLMSPLMQLLAQEVGKGREENRADTMRPETSSNLNKLLGIPETVTSQEQAQGPTMPDQAPPMATVDKPNPQAFTPQNFAGFSRPEQATVSSTAMLPKSLEQILARKVESGQLQPEAAYGMKTWGTMTPDKLAAKAITTGDQGTLDKINEYNKGNKTSPVNDFTIFSQGYMVDHPNASKTELSTAWLARQKELMLARGEGFGAARMLPVAGEKGGTEYRSAAEISAGNKAGRTSTPAGYDPNTKQLLSEAAQRGGATTANVNDARNTYHAAMPTMLALREKVAQKNLLPTGGLKSMEGFNQWALDNMSDPDVAALYTKAGMMQEALSRALGSTQGGQYMLQFASHLLNPAYTPEAFNGVVKEHMDTLDDKLRARRTFGTNPANEPTGMPNANASAQGQGNGNSVQTRSGNKFTVIQR